MGGEQLRVLVAGDKSHCGKSTISLGLLASLLELGFKPSEVAYIKPATQCVAPTLTAKYCESMGIAYVHIGPVVFYRGFTRAFLDGEHGTSEDLVRQCVSAVERISQGKRVVVIDGVGYPSVGSIVGCSSADIALACHACVLLVGKQGVGDAIDSYNLCATYFERRGIPVIGAVFNKFVSTGMYALEKCEPYLRKYFEAHRPKQRVYGLLPQCEQLAELAPEEACSFIFTHPDPEGHVLRVDPMADSDAAAVEHVRTLFREHVDVRAVVADARASVGACAKAQSRASAMRMLASEPSKLLRQPVSLFWLVLTAMAAQFVHVLLSLGRRSPQ